MPVWLTLVGAIFGTVGFLAMFYIVVVGIVEGRRAKSKPKLGLASAEKEGALTFWVNWDVGTYALQVYRLRVQLVNPHGQPQESTFTVSYEPPQKAPFSQEVTLPKEFRDVIEHSQKEFLITADFRTVEELTVPVVYSMKKIRAAYQKKGGKVPSGLAALPTAEHDHPTVFSLSYDELVARKKKMKDLEAAAKAKAAKAPPKPAAPAAGGAAPAAAGGAAPAAGGAAPTPAASASAATATATVVAAKVTAAPVAATTAAPQVTGVPAGAAPAVAPKPVTVTAPKVETKVEAKVEPKVEAKPVESAKAEPKVEKAQNVPTPVQKTEPETGAPLPSLKDLIAQVNAKVKEGKNDGQQR